MKTITNQELQSTVRELISLVDEIKNVVEWAYEQEGELFDRFTKEIKSYYRANIAENIYDYWVISGSSVIRIAEFSDNPSYSTLNVVKELFESYLEL